MDLTLQIQQRIDYLTKLIKDKQKALTRTPEGTLRITHRKGCPQYHCYTEPFRKDEKYVSTKKMPFIRSLAQKSYDAAVLKSASEELSALQNCYNAYPGKTAEEVYDSLTLDRKALVTPIIETDDAFIRKWKETEYEGKGFTDDYPEMITDSGIRVRSKSEVIIADLLDRNNLPYRYEYPLFLDDGRLIYPDFTILNVRLRKEILWEHLGMMDDPEYAETAVRKLNSLAHSGYLPGDNLILTFETRNAPLNTTLLKKLISRYLT